MKKLLFVILLISSISYSFSSDRDNKKKIEVCSFIPFKTYQEFLEEQKKTKGKEVLEHSEVQEYSEAYEHWYSQWLENNENLAYQEYLKKCLLGKQEFEKHLPEGLRKDIGNIVQGYLHIDFQQWQENNKKLLDAAYKGNVQLIKELLESGDVDINAQDQNGWTALMEAARLSNKELVKLLLEKGANINAQSLYGNTTLITAVLKKNKEIVNLLLEKGANVNIQSRDGMTALMIATWDRNKDLFELLLQIGANINIQDHNGETVLMIAQRKGYKEIAEILNKNVLA